MEKNLRIKQLLYRSNHRGCKETDILLGRFINAKCSEFLDEELNIYEELIAEDDSLIYDWILEKSPAAEKYHLILQKIRQFHKLS